MWHVRVGGTTVDVASSRSTDVAQWKRRLGWLAKWLGKGRMVRAL